MRNRFVPLAICLVGTLLGLGSACGSIPDDRKFLPEGYEPDAGSDGGRGGKGGNGGNAGGESGGASNTGGKGGAANTGGKGLGGFGGKDAGSATGGATELDAGGGTECGDTVCSSVTVGTLDLPACCTGTSSDRCGLDFTKEVAGAGCFEVNAPGTPNAKCADQTDPDDDTITYPGCCRTDTGTCGVDWAPTPTVNFGCVDPVFLSLPAGGSCTTPSCTKDDATCTDSSECCDTSKGGAVCVGFTDGSRCEQYCEKNADCKSGCCITLVSGFGACSPNAAEDCSQDCRVLEESCDTDADCCTGTFCVSNGTRGPKVCRTPCTTAAECGAEFCVQDPESGHKTCSGEGTGLCTNTCVGHTNNNKCEDGGPGATSINCALGSDCKDCATVVQAAARLGGVYLCNDTCDTASNGSCEDGGAGSTEFSCNFGGDCADCGPRLGLCSDDCRYARNGVCDDGGANAADARCATGTDCTDCSVRWGGRGQAACDGTGGTVCNPNGGQWLPGASTNSTCECADCEWDKADCTTADKCDGKQISGCCDANDSCGLADDGYCDCNGWCSWEDSDCGTSVSNPVP